MLHLSLSSRIALFWVFTLIVSIAIAILMNGVYDQGAGSQIAEGTQITRQACLELQRKFQWGLQNKSFAPEKEAQFQGALLEIILDHYTGVEGGFFGVRSKFVAYAYPTYEGSGVKRDVPEAEKETIARASQASLDREEMHTDLNRGRREAMVLTACPVSRETAAWTMTRVPLGVGVAYDRFIIGLGVLLGFVIVTGLAGTLLLFNWSRNLRALQTSIARYPVESLPELPLTLEPELNSIILAWNELSSRMRAARVESIGLQRRLGQADRLATLGKMSAGIAHEIRNPLATMRLRLENALVSPTERLPRVVPVLLEQMERMDRLVKILLSMTQPFELKGEVVKILPWLNEAFPAVVPKAQSKNLHLTFESDVSEWSFDPFHFGRAVENLLLNAVALTPAGGHIDVRVSQNDFGLRLEVRDSGPGVKPEIRPKLFEPFATGRKDGIGLGLLLVREITEAHGGTAAEVGSGVGACFRLEIPWLKS